MVWESIAYHSKIWDVDIDNIYSCKHPTTTITIYVNNCMLSHGVIRLITTNMTMSIWKKVLKGFWLKIKEKKKKEWYMHNFL